MSHRLEPTLCTGATGPVHPAAQTQLCARRHAQTWRDGLPGHRVRGASNPHKLAHFRTMARNRATISQSPVAQRHTMGVPGAPCDQGFVPGLGVPAFPSPVVPGDGGAWL